VVLGDRCFADSRNLETITFEGSSGLKRIGEGAFSGCNLQSITIPALAEAIDGTAFLNCPLIAIQVSPGSLHFTIERNQLVTIEGTEIVRYFGLDRDIVAGKKVRVLGKSCFEGCKHLDRIDFEIGSELERIGAAAVRGCVSLEIIEIPPSVTVIEEASFQWCTGFDSCLTDQNSSLISIGARAFAKCISLRSFWIPSLVERIGSNCFRECFYFYQLMFDSSESLKRIVGGRSLDDALEEIGVRESSSLFRIDIDDVGVELEFPGWVSVPDGEGSFPLTLVRDLQ
jgi:hypothetical protein